MRIAHVLWTFGTGGIQTMLVDIVNEQVKNNKVLLLVLNDIVDCHLKSKLNPDVKFVCCHRNEGSRNPYKLIKFNLHLFLFSPDIIHCHEDGITKIIKNRIPLIRTIHSAHCQTNDFNKYKKIICISEGVSQLTNSQGCFNTTTIFNGIHTDLIRKKDSHKQHDYAEVVCVGRLHPMKGQDILIKAVDILVNTKDIKNFHVTLIGEGQLRKQIEQYVKEKNLEKYVVLLGNKSRDYIYKNLCKYDLFILPSRTEGFGLTLAEACAAKVPVLSCNLPGPLEVINDGKLGRTFEAGNVSSLADAIEQFINSPQKFQHVEDAYNFVIDHFDVINTSKQYLDQYKLVTKIE